MTTPHPQIHVRQDVARLLLNDEASAVACANRLTRLHGWDAAFELADLWNVVPNLRTRLRTLNVELSPDTRQSLFARFRRSHLATTLQARRGVVLCRYLEDQGIPVVAFKGLASIACAYQGAASERTIKDVDLLIRPADLEPCLKALQAAGMQLEDGGSLDDYLAFVRHSPGFAGNEAITVRGQGQPDLDVHWSFGPRTHPQFHPDAIVARAQAVTVFDTSIRVAAPADCLLLSAHHAMRETLAVDQMLRDVLDAERWIALLEHQGRLTEALQHAELCHLDVPVRVLAEILVQRSGRARIAPADSAVSRLAGLFELQVMEGPIAKDLTYLVDRHALRQIVSGFLGGWKRHLGQMAAFETQLTGQPVPLGDRLGVRLRQLRQLKAGRWRMLRTLVKARAAYQRRS